MSGYRKIAEHPIDYLRESTLYGTPLVDWIIKGLAAEGREELDWDSLIDSSGSLGQTLYVREDE